MDCEIRYVSWCGPMQSLANGSIFFTTIKYGYAQSVTTTFIQNFNKSSVEKRVVLLDF